MQQILLISRDPDLQLTRSLVFLSAGYATLLATRMREALALANYADLAIIGHTFRPDEQADFIERAHGTNAGLYVLCLRNGLVNPEVLLRVCYDCLAAEPGAARTRVLDEREVNRWSKKAAASTAGEPDYRFKTRILRPA